MDRGGRSAKVLRDHEGRAVRLTEERRSHILEHPEMRGMEAAVEETLRRPERVVQSLGDPAARLYYRLYTETRVGEKHVCVIVKVDGPDAFVLTAYLTGRVKRGVQLWP
jgi:hypothetical protein